MDIAILAVAPGLLVWITILILPWQPWSVRETLDADTEETDVDLSDVTVLIPARNEAITIAKTISSLRQQGRSGLNVIVVDDQSTDSTTEQVLAAQLDNLTIITGKELPAGWSGKLWAMEQGRQYVTTRYLLLLDADIVLSQGLIAAVLKKVFTENLQMLSLMAFLRMRTDWERCLMPAFIFFFKLLYPFQLANRSDSRVAAAAGGFILIENDVLQRIGGFACVRNMLIDDCGLASQVKQAGYKVWIGLTHSAKSIRRYDDISTIWQMVTRTAYTQLFYSPLLLVLCTALMTTAFLSPLIALFSNTPPVVHIGLLTLLIQSCCYLPTLRYYSLPKIYLLALPFAGILFLIMTIDSAWRHHFADGASWKGRFYKK